MSYFKTKMHQIRFRLMGLRLDPVGGAYSAPRPLAGFKGPPSKRREGGDGRGGEDKGGRGRGPEGRGGGREGKGRRGDKG